MAERTVKDAKYLGSEVVVGKVTGFKSKVSHFELECICGKVFYPDFNHDADQWINCFISLPFKKGEESSRRTDRYYDFLACSPHCRQAMKNSIKEGERNYIFKECLSEGCDNLIPVQGNFGTEEKFSAHRGYCIKCKPLKDKDFISAKTVLRKQKKAEKDLIVEKKAQKKFEESFFQGGSPGLKSQK